MKISKLIKALQEIQKADGDTEVHFDFLYHSSEAYLVKEDASSNCKLWSKEITDSETVFYVLKEDTVDNITDKSIELVTKNGLIDLKNPLPSELMSLEDTASILASKYRWDSNTSRLISVARHLIVSAIYAPDEFKKEALLHDLTEAYIGDMARPLKTACPDFCTIEDTLYCVIAGQYDLPKSMSPEVKRVDDYVQKFEIKYLDTTPEATFSVYTKMPIYNLEVPDTELTRKILKIVYKHKNGAKGVELYPKKADIKKDTYDFLKVWLIVNGKL